MVVVCVYNVDTILLRGVKLIVSCINILKQLVYVICILVNHIAMHTGSVYE